jgi:hypothetical protein
LSDIFHEVDEEVRREQLKKLWDRYGNLIVAAAVVVVFVIGGWRGYQWWQARQAAQAGVAFDAAADLAEQGHFAEADAAFQRVAAEGTAGYRVLARLRAAAALGETDRKAAVAAYDAIAGDNSVAGEWQALAGIRAGLLLADSAPFGELSQRLEPLAQPNGAFRHTARELLAFAAWRAGDMAAAKRWADAIAADPETPQGLRTRIEVLTALTDSGKS